MRKIQLVYNTKLAPGDYIAASDRHIKDNITDVDDGSALYCNFHKYHGTVGRFD